jgi:hypothetical protein
LELFQKTKKDEDQEFPRKTKKRQKLLTSETNNKQMGINGLRKIFFDLAGNPGARPLKAWLEESEHKGILIDGKNFDYWIYGLCETFKVFSDFECLFAVMDEVLDKFAQAGAELVFYYETTSPLKVKESESAVRLEEIVGKQRAVFAALRTGSSLEQKDCPRPALMSFYIQQYLSARNHKIVLCIGEADGQLARDFREKRESEKLFGIFSQDSDFLASEGIRVIADCNRDLKCKVFTSEEVQNVFRLTPKQIAYAAIISGNG